MMRYNRLIGLKQELEFLEQGINSQGRMQGKTTALCLKYLSEAISNPGVSVKIEDHHKEGGRIDPFYDAWKNNQGARSQIH
jgi:hypothetical protein